MSISAPITIILIDDHASVRWGLRAYLSTQPDFNVIGEAGSGEEAVEAISGLLPDIVLLDMIMPGKNGIEVPREIKRISPRTKVVILTSLAGEQNRSLALNAGANLYLLKNLKMEMLAKKLRDIMRGETNSLSFARGTRGA